MSLRDQVIVAIYSGLVVDRLGRPMGHDDLLWAAKQAIEAADVLLNVMNPP